MGPPRRKAAARSGDNSDLEKRLRRAVDDVMTGDISFDTAHKNRVVPHEKLRAALHAAGWKPRVAVPGPRRRAFGGGRDRA